MITTVANVKAKLAVEGNALDTVLTNLIKGAQKYVEGYCDREFPDADAEYTEYFDEMPIILKNTPVEAVSSLAYWDGTAYVVEDTDNYRVLSKGRIDYDFERGLDRVKVVYTGGDTPPEDVREVVERIVMRQFRKRKNEGESSTAFNDSTTSWGDTVDSHDREVLNRYRMAWI